MTYQVLVGVLTGQMLPLLSTRSLSKRADSICHRTGMTRPTQHSKAGVLKALAMTNRTQQAAAWKSLSQQALDQYWIIRPVFRKGQIVWGSKVGGAYFWEPQGTFGFGQLYVKA